MLTQTQPVDREPLTWLFAAHFEDGSIFRQPANDRSINHVEGAEHNPSAFSDVLANKKKLEAFSLVSTDGKRTVSVSLITGEFFVDGLKIDAHNQHFEPSNYELELVYFRETRVVTTGGQIERHFVNRYFIGWRTMVNNKPKQVTLAVG